MSLTKDDKLQIMEWAVELAKLEFTSQRNLWGSDIKRATDILAAMKPDTNHAPKTDMQTIVGSIYQSLIDHID